MWSETCAHISETDLDLYALGHLPETEAGSLEEHLLTCPSCCKRLTETDRFIDALRSARALLDPHAPPRPKPVSFAQVCLGFAPALVLLAAAMFLLTLVPILRPGDRPHSEVVLLAIRSTGPETVLSVPAGRGATLDLDLAQAPTVRSWRVRIVNNRGALVWTGTADSMYGVAQIRVERSLDAGNYWVRLYDSAAPSDLLKEYGFRVR